MSVAFASFPTSAPPQIAVTQIKLNRIEGQPVTVAQNSAGIPSYYLNGFIPTTGPIGEITVSLITGE
jgi:hypothetical protein